MLGGFPPYTYSLDGISYTTANYFIGVPADVYVVHVEDAAGCITTLPITVASQPKIELTAGNDVNVQLGASIQLQAIASSSNTLTVAWTPAATLSNATITAPLATPTSTTLYTVAVIDPFGCGAKDDVLVTVIKNRNVYIPTAFSPNGDGNNDIFEIGRAHV